MDDKLKNKTSSKKSDPIFPSLAGAFLIIIIASLLFLLLASGITFFWNYFNEDLNWKINLWAVFLIIFLLFILMLIYNLITTKSNGFSGGKSWRHEINNRYVEDYLGKDENDSFDGDPDDDIPEGGIYVG